MILQQTPFEATQSFTSFFLDYINQKEPLKKFYNRFPSLQNFSGQIKEKSSFNPAIRKILVDALNRQYQNIELSETVKKNLASLQRSTTFTVTTGHQLNICTGPLYFIYKIITVINACKRLKSEYPKYDFVPVYWMATEDHDYDEIKSFRLYGKKYTWGTNQKGAVGRFSTAGLTNLLQDVPGDTKLFRTAYSKHKFLRDSVRHYVNELFGKEGLVVVDGDDRELKKSFIPVIEEDILRSATKTKVDQTNAALENAGYKSQVYCRDINFFYLEDGLRSRIEKSGDRFQIVDTTLSFSESEVKNLIKTEPEKFSPNVILRPLYQEIILPNLAYIGGPAEVVYWLQLKEAFTHYKTPFPILLPRNFALILDQPSFRKFQKTGLELSDLFMERNFLINHTTLKFARNSIRLNGEKETIENQFNLIKKNAEAIDASLGPLVGAETRRAIKSLEKIEQKLLKAEKRYQSDRIRQVESLKDSLFPNGGLQERTDNFLNFYQSDPQFIQKLINYFDPFDFRMNVLIDK